MSNEVAVAPQPGFLTTNDDYFSALAGLANSIKGGSGGKAFMKFDGNTGEFSYGAENEELSPGTLLAMNPMSFKMGWVIWKGGAVVHEKMVGLNEGTMPTKASLPDHGPYDDDGEGPTEQYTVEFSTMEDPIVQMIFQANNNSKRRAMGALLKAFRGEFRLHPGQFPVVEINVAEFEAKISGSKRKVKKFAPEFKIVQWISEGDMTALAEGTPEDYENTDTGEGDATQTAAEATQRPQPQRPAAAGGVTNRAAPRKLNRF